MSHHARDFLLACLSSVALVYGSLATATVALGFEPSEGDLTRLGGYSENDFGWHGRAVHFRDDHTNTQSVYDKPYDVVVLGDSFSERKAEGWQNTLVARTGWSLVTIYPSNQALAALAASPLFKHHPPRLIVWQGVERGLSARFAQAGRDGRFFIGCLERLTPGSRRVSQRVALRLQPRALSTVVSERRSARGPSYELDLTKEILLKRLLRKGLGLNLTPVVEVGLTRGGLFSSRADRELIFLGDDLYKKNWSAADLEAIAATWRELAQRLAALGIEFVPMIAPDKLSAYAPYVRDERFRQLGVIERLAGLLGVPMPRLDNALARAIAAGERDVYLPNDTHWGATGHRIAAEALLTFLQARGLAAH